MLVNKSDRHDAISTLNHKIAGHLSILSASEESESNRDLIITNMKSILLKKLALFITLAVCMFMAKDNYAQEQEPWQKDWQKFGEAIAPYANKGVVERKTDFREFNRIFSKQVEWVGMLAEFYSNSVANELVLAMPPIQITLRDGSAIDVNNLSISCGFEQSGCKGWSAELIGKKVKFRTQLINRTSGYLPVVRLSGKTYGTDSIYIETDGGELIEVLSE